VKNWITDHTTKTVESCVYKNDNYWNQKMATHTQHQWFCSETSVEWHFYEEAWTVKQETAVKSFKKCGACNTLDGTEDDVPFEESDSSDSNTSNDECWQPVMKILWDSMTSRNLLLHFHVVE
jgi:hypothetical protein